MDTSWPDCIKMSHNAITCPPRFAHICPLANTTKYPHIAVVIFSGTHFCLYFDHSGLWSYAWKEAIADLIGVAQMGVLSEVRAALSRKWSQNMLRFDLMCLLYAGHSEDMHRKGGLKLLAGFQHDTAICHKPCNLQQHPRETNNTLCVTLGKALSHFIIHSNILGKPCSFPEIYSDTRIQTIVICRLTLTSERKKDVTPWNIENTFKKSHLIAWNIQQLSRKMQQSSIICLKKEVNRT